MCPKIVDITKYLVARWAALDANFLLFNDVHQLWMQGQVESMTDSLTTQENGIIELGVIPRQTLTCMKIDVPVGAHLLLGLHHHLKELFDLEVVIFFVDHVEALHHIIVAFGVYDAVEHRLDVGFADNLESAVDDLHLE